jgi:hypothetical protein
VTRSSAPGLCDNLDESQKDAAVVSALLLRHPNKAATREPTSCLLL